MDLNFNIKLKQKKSKLTLTNRPRHPTNLRHLPAPWNTRANNRDETLLRVQQNHAATKLEHARPPTSLIIDQSLPLRPPGTADLGGPMRTIIEAETSSVAAAFYGQTWQTSVTRRWCNRMDLKPLASSTAWCSPIEKSSQIHRWIVKDSLRTVRKELQILDKRRLETRNEFHHWITRIEYFNIYFFWNFLRCLNFSLNFGLKQIQICSHWGERGDEEICTYIQLTVGRRLGFIMVYL
jgi:hypothetical protein